MKNTLKFLKGAFCLLTTVLLLSFYPADKKEESKSSLLWKISGNGLSTPSYLYGTVKMICKEDFSVTDQMKAAFEQTDLTVMELDIDDPSFEKEMQMYMMNPGMQNISEVLNVNDNEVVNQFFIENYGNDIKQLGILKPSVLSLLVSQKLLKCSANSYKKELVKLSKENNKEIKALETVKFQGTLLDEIPMRIQVKWLVEKIRNKEKVEENIKSMTNAFKNNDLDKLFELVMADPMYKTLESTLLYERNAKWIPKIEEYIKNQPALIAVGAGHLGSDKGVIALLKEKGYTVEPVLN